MLILTDYQNRLCAALEASGGEAVSLFRLAVEADMLYQHAHRALRQLEAQDVVAVSRINSGPGGRGKPLVMRLRRGHVDRQLALQGMDVADVVKSFRPTRRRS